MPTSHLEIYPNIIHPSTPSSPQLSPSLRFPHQDPIRPPLLTHTDDYDDDDDDNNNNNNNNNNNKKKKTST